MGLSVVINPGNSEEDLPLGCAEPFEKSRFPVLLFVGLDDHTQGLQNLLYSLMKFGLSRVLFNYIAVNLINIRHFFFLLIVFIIIKGISTKGGRPLLYDAFVNENNTTTQISQNQYQNQFLLAMSFLMKPDWPL